ncbi:DUF418 domain-containing protein [Corynebacterium guangdongense]|uniref:Membrane protein YeiB n=1 Tax=Corynebacterium guangdongense TaxID=1783348 RepID=A0ABU1ZYD0_9CORY|nr:DUF418 domain-containing protein [Corynebacterium guangdongense]MDR7329906.1 putative membrane protein YeiB [Corynebacterium guangdongense]WJZ18464.1 hypothetical protein CGUA_09545 [Corynebacterium guangdongense]
MSQIDAPPRQRIIAPDIARGLALFGIAWANLSTAWAVVPAEVRGAGFGGVGPFGFLDEVAVVLSAMFAHVRGLPMFTTLLGFGIGLIALSLARRGYPQREIKKALAKREIKKALAKRYGWLAAFGALHAVFLFFGDIMFTYGVLAMIVILLLGRSDRTLLRTAGVIWLAITVVTIVVGALVPAEYLGQDLGQLLPDFPHYPFYVLFGAGWLLITAASLPMTALSLLPVMLVGFVAARQGVHLHIDRYRRVLWAAVAVTVLVILGVGLPMGLAALGILPGEWSSMLMILNQVFGVLTGPGIAAAILLACEPLEKRRRAGATLALPLRMVAALGKRSMSGYLAQSVLFLIICLPFTLGVGKEIGAFGQFLLALSVWSVTLGLAWALELAGRPGPFEQLHRRLSYGRDGLPQQWPEREIIEERLPAPAQRASASMVPERPER